jgi:hypothetical protein
MLARRLRVAKPQAIDIQQLTTSKKKFDILPTFRYYYYSSLRHFNTFLQLGGDGVGTIPLKIIVPRMIRLVKILG